jgi:O-antigen/teichoic acid export membrane protein
MDHTREIVGDSVSSAGIATVGHKHTDLSTVVSTGMGQADREAPALTGISMLGQKQEDILTVARGGSLVFVGGAAARGIYWVYNTALVWGLGPESYGMFTLALAITTFVGVVANLGLSQGIVRFGAISARDEGLAGIHRATMAGLRIALPAGLAIMLGLLWSADLIAVSIFKKPELVPLLRGLGLSVPFMSLQASLLAGTVARKIMRYSVIVSIVQPLAALILAIALMALGYGVLAIALAFVVSCVLGAALALYYYLQLIPPKYRTRESFSLRQMFKFSIPLALNNLVNYTNQRTEVFFLGLLPGAIPVGIYNIAWSISGTETMFVTSLSAVISPFTSDLSHRRAISQLESLYKTTAKWAFTGALTLFLIFFFSAPTIMNVFDPAYVAGAGVLIALGFARLLGTTAGSAGTVLIMSGRSDLSLLNTIIILATSIGLDWLLIPRYGLAGAAGAGAVTVALADLLRVVEVWLTLKIHPFAWSFTKPIIAGLSALTVVYLLREAVGLKSLWIEMVYWVIFAVTNLIIIYLLRLDAGDLLVLNAVRSKVGAFRTARQGKP